MKKNSGNALWFILLAIFLLGGLTVLLSRTGSNTEETGSIEKERLMASSLVQYGSSIATAIQSLLSRGCGENQISLSYDTNNDGVINASDTYYNANSPSDYSCHVFHINGAGLSYKKFDATIGANPAFLISNNAIAGIGTNNNIDIYMRLTDWMNTTKLRKVCEQVNIISGVGKTGTAIAGGFDPQYGASFVTLMPFTGTFASSASTVVNAPLFSGKKAFCEGAGTTTVYFFYVLLAR